MTIDKAIMRSCPTCRQPDALIALGLRYDHPHRWPANRDRNPCPADGNPNRDQHAGPGHVPVHHLARLGDPGEHQQ